MTILVTGAAGFIGFHLSQSLLANGQSVLGYDNLNDYYDISLKKARLEQLKPYEGFHFYHASLEDKATLTRAMIEHKVTKIVHLAAQAGVRYSLTHPQRYIDSNIQGFMNILELSKEHGIEHLVYASSSSVYGANTSMPFSVHDNVDHPISLYAASKKANELMAHVYSHLYQIPTTGLRFFTVYGPWGRPDMALFLFTKAMLKGEAINVFNYGKMKRDFTYIDDIIDGIKKVLDQPASPNENWSSKNPAPATSKAPYRLYNIGNHSPVDLLEMIQLLEKYLNQKAHKNMIAIQPGDVPETYADINDLSRVVGFLPQTPLEEGIKRFVAWYLNYYQIS